jgi:hypothetical protein
LLVAALAVKIELTLVSASIKRKPNVRYWPSIHRENAIDVAIWVKRTWACALHMSAYDPKQTSCRITVR